MVEERDFVSFLGLLSFLKPCPSQTVVLLDLLSSFRTNIFGPLRVSLVPYLCADGPHAGLTNHLTLALSQRYLQTA